jgi:hypothetical protein
MEVNQIDTKPFSELANPIRRKSTPGNQALGLIVILRDGMSHSERLDPGRINEGLITFRKRCSDRIELHVDLAMDSTKSRGRDSDV